MNARPSIQQVLLANLLDGDDGGTVTFPAAALAAEVTAALHAATADRPIRSADGTLVAHRADPELAGDLRYWADDAEAGCDHGPAGPECCRYSFVADIMRRAARFFGGEVES